jgi:hypothetical protein
MTQELLEVGAEYGLRPAGENAFNDWIKRLIDYSPRRRGDR